MLKKLLAVAFVLLLASANLSVAQDVQGTPEGLLQAVQDAFNSNDSNKIRKLIDPGTIDEFDEEEFDFEDVTFKFELEKKVQKDDWALMLVSVTYEMHGETDTDNEALLAHKVDGKWYMCFGSPGSVEAAPEWVDETLEEWGESDKSRELDPAVEYSLAMPHEFKDYTDENVRLLGYFTKAAIKHPVYESEDKKLHVYYIEVYTKGKSMFVMPVNSTTEIDISEYEGRDMEFYGKLIAIEGKDGVSYQLIMDYFMLADGDEDEYASIMPSEFKEYVGSKVCLLGEFVNIPMQHPLYPERNEKMNLFYAKIYGEDGEGDHYIPVYMEGEIDYDELEGVQVELFGMLVCLTASKGGVTSDIYQLLLDYYVDDLESTKKYSFIYPGQFADYVSKDISVYGQFTTEPYSHPMFAMPDRMMYSYVAKIWTDDDCSEYILVPVYFDYELDPSQYVDVDIYFFGRLVRVEAKRGDLEIKSYQIVVEKMDVLHVDPFDDEFIEIQPDEFKDYEYCNVSIIGRFTKDSFSHQMYEFDEKPYVYYAYVYFKYPTDKPEYYHMVVYSHEELDIDDLSQKDLALRGELVRIEFRRGNEFIAQYHLILDHFDIPETPVSPIDEALDSPVLSLRYLLHYLKQGNAEMVAKFIDPESRKYFLEFVERGGFKKRDMEVTILKRLVKDDICLFFCEMIDNEKEGSGTDYDVMMLKRFDGKWYSYMGNQNPDTMEQWVKDFTKQCKDEVETIKMIKAYLESFSQALNKADYDTLKKLLSSETYEHLMDNKEMIDKGITASFKLHRYLVKGDILFAAALFEVNSEDYNDTEGVYVLLQKTDAGLVGTLGDTLRDFGEKNEWLEETIDEWDEQLEEELEELEALEDDKPAPDDSGEFDLDHDKFLDEFAAAFANGDKKALASMLDPVMEKVLDEEIEQMEVHFKVSRISKRGGIAVALVDITMDKGGYQEIFVFVHYEKEGWKLAFDTGIRALDLPDWVKETIADFKENGKNGTVVEPVKPDDSGKKDQEYEFDMDSHLKKLATAFADGDTETLRNMVVPELQDEIDCIEPMDITLSVCESTKKGRYVVALVKIEMEDDSTKRVFVFVHYIKAGWLLALDNVIEDLDLPKWAKDEVERLKEKRFDTDKEDKPVSPDDDKDKPAPHEDE